MLQVVDLDSATNCETFVDEVISKCNKFFTTVSEVADFFVGEFLKVTEVAILIKVS